jgi:acyl carrier protein
MGYVREGSLVVTGRAKDIIFVNGRNLYAEDLERIAGQIKGIDGRKIAICGSFDQDSGRDRILMFLRGGSHEKALSFFFQARQELQERAGALVDVMIPLKSIPFPRTSSGKLQRYKLVQQYEQGEFDESIAQLNMLLAEEQAKQVKVSPRSTNEKLIHRLWCEELMLKPEQVGIHDHFADLGGESINAIVIITRLEKRYNIRINSENLAEYPTIAAISAYLDTHPLLQTGKGKRKGIFKG